MSGPKGERRSFVLAGRRPVLELLRAGRVPERILIARGLAPAQILGQIRRRAEAASVTVDMTSKAELDRIALGLNHQGIVALTARYRYSPLEQLFRPDAPCVLFLDGVTDPHNLGSLLRSAESAGFNGVVIPAHRSAGVTDAVRRVSAGAAEVLPVARVAGLTEAVERARSAGLWILGLDSAADEDLWSSNLAEPPVGVVLGSEDRGISRNLREHCDGLVRIPQGGALGSLNVAVAGAVAMFEVMRRRRPAPTNRAAGDG